MGPEDHTEVLSRNKFIIEEALNRRISFAEAASHLLLRRKSPRPAPELLKTAPLRRVARG